MINTQYTEVVQTSLEQVQDAQIEDGLSERFDQAMSLPESNNGLEGGLLENISELKSNIDNAKSSLQDSMEAVGDNPAKLLEMQWALTRITFQEELIAKTVGKTTQNVETLLKAQ
ncbi:MULTISPECIES: type III secretion system inner rod subunit SctI [Vibrio]|jgi:type III secretion protein I|uniref:EscI/YscI/HrpB family type III secretion system inner rod protein n=3 Tax=Vibrio oreintalis group TaxID=1891919 RepID=A0A177XU01_9VIBR|nr:MULTISPECIES: type III secretion system inner rod subunit SctI [Vibrio]AIW14391.1 type III export protein [Vibrio tubiashii ATCC 19109]EGU53848.1 type III export protein [Vibrio tubiashii ATCC 19109]EIF03950.1 type III export protein [Vibrio tubiashii NCIMB 1337 = ATCC 19106]KLN64708.1 type III export protein [Vibrio sp. VPAP30]MCG9579421.1 type III secretion system inner rod subunit SctI [Vibrio tubiashii]